MTHGESPVPEHPRRGRRGVVAGRPRITRTHRPRGTRRRTSPPPTRRSRPTPRRRAVGAPSTTTATGRPGRRPTRNRPRRGSGSSESSSEKVLGVSSTRVFAVFLLRYPVTIDGFSKCSFSFVICVTQFAWLFACFLLTAITYLPARPPTSCPASESTTQQLDAYQ